MTRSLLVVAGLVAGLSLLACNPTDDAVDPTCDPVECAIDNCASRGGSGGRCIASRCVCDGTPTGTCFDGYCAAACMTYGGGVTGHCSTPTHCECLTEVPDDAAGPDVPVGAYGFANGVVVVVSTAGTFPIAGALVYAQRSTSPVAPIPEGNYCPRCLDMTTLPHTFSAADGYFRLENLAVGDWTLVVQKGQFRRVRQFTVSRHLEEVDIPTDYTTLPNVQDPASGDTIPRIAVALGAYDRMEDILAKVRLAELDPSSRAVLSTASFDYYNNGSGYGIPGFDELVTDPARMARYQIIFVPCSDSTNDALLGDAAVQENIRNWVANGGKWYVSDWSYEWVTFIFPGAINLYGDRGSPGDADVTPHYNGPGRVLDEDMAGWLGAMGIDPDSMSFEEIYNNICSLGTIHATDEDGAPVDVTPKTWAEGRQLANACGGGDYPYTVTFPFGCGRVLYTSYHTVGQMGGPHPELMPQERILLYLIMEIGVCTDEVIIW
ncbi:MAG: carboxypeptidase regulatory-like domain-containing protein [Deltaproteobacteria bacterium]|nr:carboxypeptidase regulatory-like domain-containing protein [Deltaproteobacteria bacterium]